MKPNLEAKIIYTSEPFYDLFDGGYIKPEELLIEGAEEVYKAMDTIQEFFYLLEQEGLIEYT